MASYQLIGAFATVQVVSPTNVADIEYCTILTSPSNVTASMPIPIATFTSDGGVIQLTSLADAIEQIMRMAHVIAGTGVQTLDANGLLQDQVVFTVQYIPPNNATASITAEANIPVTMLVVPGEAPGTTQIVEAEAIVQSVYDNLQTLAGG